ncbi:glycosyltransferase [Pantoea sp. PNT03]|jgi:GT2 family glycosyltransferase|uniref:glycosyltransferase n=1 Tax=Pantoea sp. PNT03 TaxID=2769258 RepID=UPI001784FEC1|nr:glycosyltransferase [Pantoea sp. PNT03]MBD9658333.1 glycosyltransferase [Pantoea sp. PNT03]
MNLTALIVTYNRLDKLKKTYEATLKLPFKHIVIVNNNSTDTTKDWLNLLINNRLTIVHRDTNDGGSGGFRFGAEFIANNITTDWVVFYDDDAYPQDNFIEKFKAIEPNQNTIYCSKVINTSEEVCKMNLPWKKRTLTIIENITYLRNNENFIADENEIDEVITFSFVGCIISNKMLIQNYEFIKNELFIYYDDVYFSHYLYRCGYKIFYRPELIFIHDVGSLNNWNGQEWKVYYLSRNMFLCKILYNYDFFSFSGKVLRLAKYFFDGFRNKNKKKYFVFFARGVMDGLKKISGIRH